MSSSTCDDTEFGSQATTLNLESDTLGIELAQPFINVPGSPSGTVQLRLPRTDSGLGASRFPQNGNKEQDTQNGPDSLDEKYEIANPKSAITNSENASNLVGLNFQHFCKLY